MLPIDLVLVRHGLSEGNLAKRLSEGGDHSAYTPEFMRRHSSSFRLSATGRQQAIQAGRWVEEEFFKDGWQGFDRYYTSEYLRAIETAARMNLPSARWYTDYYLTERDWGELDILAETAKSEKFAESLRLRQAEPFFWRPPNGESYAQLCLRIDRVLQTLHRECSDKRVLIVCHGEVMRAFQVRIERISQERFRELTFSNDPMDRIHNCQVVHYSRRNPWSGKLDKHVSWVRFARPTETPVFVSDWREIERPSYNNKDLLEMARKSPAMIE